MFEYCPKCTKKVMPEWKCCPYCGCVFEAEDAPAPESGKTDEKLGDALGNLFGFEKEQKAQNEWHAQEDKLRVMIIRGSYDEARSLCNARIDADPMDKAGYLGLIRIASKNYKEYEGAEIAEQIRIAEEVFAGREALSADPEYAKYIAARKQYFEEKERKRKEEAEAARIAAVEAEAERRRIEEEKRRRGDPERRRKEREEIKPTLAAFAFEEDNEGTYTITGVKNKAITSITIPQGVTSIGDNAFNECMSLTNITIPNSVTSIGERAFCWCSRLTSITIPQGVTSIRRGTFYFCGSLARITLPNSVTSIELSAFINCSRLSDITIPNSVTSIGAHAFSGCSSLSEIEIPNSVTSIGDRAFAGCTCLTRITIPDSVTSIGSEAFYGCSSLTSITISQNCSYQQNSFPENCRVIKR